MRGGGDSRKGSGISDMASADCDGAGTCYRQLSADTTLGTGDRAFRPGTALSCGVFVCFRVRHLCQSKDFSIIYFGRFFTLGLTQDQDKHHRGSQGASGGASRVNPSTWLLHLPHPDEVPCVCSQVHLPHPPLCI